MRAVALAVVCLALASCEATGRPGGPPGGRVNADARVDEDRGSSDGDLSGDSGEGSDASDAFAGDASFSDANDSDRGFDDAAPFPDATIFPDAFTPDAPSFPDAFTSDGGPVCAELAACCFEIPPPLDAQCNLTAMSGDPARCESALNSARMFGFCGGHDAGSRPDSGRPPDSGVHPDASSFDAGPPLTCADLAACCATLPDPGNCDQIVQLGSNTICGGFLMQLQSTGQCPP